MAKRTHAWIYGVIIGGLAVSHCCLAQQTPRLLKQTIRLAGDRPGAEASGWGAIPGWYYLKLSPGVDGAGVTGYWLSWEYAEESGAHSWGYGRVPEKLVTVNGFDSMKLAIPDLTLLEEGVSGAEYCNADGSCQLTAPAPLPLSGTWSVPFPWGYSRTEITTGTVETRREFLGEVQYTRRDGRWERNVACFDGTIGPMQVICGTVHKNGSMYVYKGVSTEQTWYELSARH